jgi:dihydroorotase
VSTLTLRNAFTVFEDGGRPADIYIDGEVIVGVYEPGSAPRGDRVIECSGLAALPGLIDLHSHHREPGFTHKEDITSSGLQCAAGGVTVSVGMPNVSPIPNTAAVVDEILEIYRAKSIVDYNLNPAATKLEEIEAIAQRGVLAFKIFMVEDTGRDYPHMPGLGVHDHGRLFSTFREVAKTGRPLMVHPHDQSLMDVIEQEFWQRGERDALAYAKAYSYGDGLVWDVAVATLLRLQEATDVRLHLLHTMTTRTVKMIAAAKRAGRTVTAEANPWALWLGNDWANIERLGSYALSYYVPPAGSAAVYAGLIDGTVDMIATDHAPHLREEKEIGWTDGWKAHTGTPSLQFYLSLLLTDVNAGKISLERAAYITATAPAKAVDLYPRKGAIQVGADADIVLVDLARRHTISDAEVLSKCGWTPYAGREVVGIPVSTILRGSFVFEDGLVTGLPGAGHQATPVGST